MIYPVTVVGIVTLGVGLILFVLGGFEIVTVDPYSTENPLITVEPLEGRLLSERERQRVNGDYFYPSVILIGGGLFMVVTGLFGGTPASLIRPGPDLSV